MSCVLGTSVHFGFVLKAEVCSLLYMVMSDGAVMISANLMSFLLSNLQSYVQSLIAYVAVDSCLYGNWTTRRLLTRGLNISRTGQLAD